MLFERFERVGLERRRCELLVCVCVCVWGGGGGGVGGNPGAFCPETFLKLDPLKGHLLVSPGPENY